MKTRWTQKYRYAKICAYENGLVWYGGPEVVYPSLEAAGFKYNWRTYTWSKPQPSLTDKQRRVLELLKCEGGRAEHYFIVQLCGLYFDNENTLETLRKDGLTLYRGLRDKSWHSITTAGYKALSECEMDT